MQTMITGKLPKILGFLSFLALSGCYKCYTSGCTASYTKQVDDFINNNPAIIDYENRRILCDSASSLTSISSNAWSNDVSTCKVTWKLATN